MAGKETTASRHSAAQGSGATRTARGTAKATSKDPATANTVVEKGTEKTAAKRTQAAKKTTTKKSTTKKSTTKTVAKKTTAKKTTAKKSTAKKSAAKKSTTKRVALAPSPPGDRTADKIPSIRAWAESPARTKRGQARLAAVPASQPGAAEALAGNPVQDRTGGGEPRVLRPRVHEGWGPFHNAETTARRLNVDRDTVLKRGQSGELLMVKTVESEFLFPVWQFQGRIVHPLIAKVLKVFRGVPVNRWLIVQWATTPDAQLGNLSVVEWLHNPERDPAAALADAHHYAWRWSQ